MNSMFSCNTEVVNMREDEERACIPFLTSEGLVTASHILCSAERAGNGFAQCDNSIDQESHGELKSEH